MHLADEGIPHAFVLKNSDHVATRVAPVVLRHSRSSTNLSKSEEEKEERECTVGNKFNTLTISKSGSRLDTYYD